MWDPFSEIEDSISNLPVINNMAKKAFVPAMDVYQTDDAVVVEAPLAGVNSDDVKVGIENGILTISGSSKKEHEVDDKNYYRKEVRSGAFYREIVLPAKVSEDKINAEFDDGMLKITCPKIQDKKSTKTEVKIIKK